MIMETTKRNYKRVLDRVDDPPDALLETTKRNYKKFFVEHGITSVRLETTKRNYKIDKLVLVDTAGTERDETTKRNYKVA